MIVYSSSVSLTPSTLNPSRLSIPNKPMALEIQLNDRFTVRHVSRDGSPTLNVTKIRCPSCRTFGEVDQDQWQGRVSIECSTPGCTFHETHNFAQLEADALK